MKHKFKPSVGSNRARKAAPGGGRCEKQSSGVGQDQPAAGIFRSRACSTNVRGEIVFVIHRCSPVTIGTLITIPISYYNMVHFSAKWAEASA